MPQAANSLVRKFGTRDPEKIARELGIQIYNVPMKKQKGMYKVIKRNCCIFINDNLDEVMRTIVLLHEIGHDQLHRRQAVCFQEFQLFDMSKNTMEYEANLFASQIALPDDEVIDYIYQGFSIDQIAGEDELRHQSRRDQSIRAVTTWLCFPSRRIQNQLSQMITLITWPVHR